jgi:L-lactate dehydrogenase complex protein LldG
MNSREQILGKLRQGKQSLPGKRPFPHVTPPQNHLPMVPLQDKSAAGLYGRFVTEATQAACQIHEAASNEAAIAAILQLVGDDTTISSWDPAHIPLPGLAAALDAANIARVGQDATVRVGLTGVDAALAATGSVVVMSGNGRSRTASLLPLIHIAVVAASQIVPDLENWWTTQKAAGLAQTRQHSNIVVITGPSRTADIAMQLVMGMHGPRELHLILLPNR